MKKFFILLLMTFVTAFSFSQNNDWVSIYEEEGIQYINVNIEKENFGYRFWVKTILHGRTKPTKDDPKTHELSHRLDYWFITYDYTKACNLAFYVYSKEGKVIINGQVCEEDRMDAAEYIVPDTDLWFFKGIVKEFVDRKRWRVGNESLSIKEYNGNNN